MNSETEDSAQTQVEETNLSTKSRKDTNKLPKNAFALYVKLYCRKFKTKSKHTSKMIEATKSWITLNNLEKQKFYNKYKECQQKYSDVILSCLQKSQPFMKEKGCPGSHNNYENIKDKEATVTDSEPSLLADDKIKTNVPCSTDNENHNATNIIIDKTTEIPVSCADMESEEIENACVEEENTLNDPSKIAFPEPIAPSIKTGKELFEIIQANVENDLTWTSLPQRERNLYNRAILAMKRDYIGKYKMYLQKLTDKDLFHHYYKCFRS